MCLEQVASDGGRRACGKHHAQPSKNSKCPGIKLFMNMNSLNLLNSVVQNYFRKN